MNSTTNVRIENMRDGVSYEWDSYEEFLPDMAEIAKAVPVQMRRIVDSCPISRDHWWGCSDGFMGVQQRVQDGWPELREKCTDMLEGIELDIPVFPSFTHTRKRKRQWSDHGDVLNMPRVWSGQLDKAWVRPVRTERLAYNSRRVTVAFDVTANAVVSNDMAMWRAALCILLCDSLARAGRVFETWVVDSTLRPFVWGSGVPQKLWAAWCVKRASDPLLIDRICAMVSVGFMRSAGFVAMSAGPWHASPGFGAALGFGLPATLRKRQAEGEVVVRIGQCYSRAEVLEQYRMAWEEVEAMTGIKEAV